MFGDSIRFGPRGALRASYIDFGRTAESGGPTALVIDRDDIESFQGRAGLVVEGVGRIRPNFTATYVHEFEDRSPFFGANFVGGIGPNAGFDLAEQDDDWFEVAGGLTIATGQIEVSVSADTTLDRDDVENQSYRASVKFRF
jgi:outer membrane autotransporter protein